MEEVGSFTDLKLIVAALRKEEIKLARERFGKNRDQQRITNPQRLFEYIIHNPNAEEDKTRIYLRETKNAFGKTVLRLLKILDYSLVSDSNIVDSNYFSLRFQKFFEITMTLNAIDIYRTRGIQNRSIKLLNDAIQFAKEIEEYGLLIELLYNKYHWLTLTGLTKTAKKYYFEILHYEVCRKSLFEATITYNEIMGKLHRNSGANLTPKMRQAIESVKGAAVKTQSAQINYYSLILEYSRSVNDKQFETAEKIASEFFKLVSQNVCLNKKQNIGIANLFLADSYLHNHKFDLSIQFSKLAKEYFKPNSYNYLHSEELEFYSLFYQGKYSDAEEKIVTIFKSPHYTKSSYLENKKEYFLACIYFAQERYHDCVRLLNTISEIPKDKTGWNLGIKNLTIMLTIINKDYDATSRLVESYSRDILRIKKVKVIRKRDLLILKLFRKYVQYGNPDQAVQSLGAEFKLLFSNEDEYIQLIPGHELISVHKWFQSLIVKKVKTYLSN